MRVKHLPDTNAQMAEAAQSVSTAEIVMTDPAVSRNIGNAPRNVTSTDLAGKVLNLGHR